MTAVLLPEGSAGDSLISSLKEGNAGSCHILLNPPFAVTFHSPIYPKKGSAAYECSLFDCACSDASRADVSKGGIIPVN